MSTNKRLGSCQIKTAFSKSKIGNRKSKIKSGLTLIEIMVVVVIIAVAVLGAMSFRFYCVTDAKKADVQANAVRIGSMMLETWKGMGGANPVIYNPLTSFSAYSTQFAIQTSTGPTPPTGFASLPNKYRVQDLANDVYYYVTLSYVSATSTMPAALNATVSWNQNYGTTGTTAHAVSLSTYAD